MTSTSSAQRRAWWLGLPADLVVGRLRSLEAVPLQHGRVDRGHLEVDVPLLAAEGGVFDVRGVAPEHPPALVAVDHRNAVDLVAAELAVELRAAVVDPLDGRLTGDGAFVAAEVQRALGLQLERLKLAELVGAAERLDGLVEDGHRVL